MADYNGTFVKWGGVEKRYGNDNRLQQSIAMEAGEVMKMAAPTADELSDPVQNVVDSELFLFKTEVVVTGDGDVDISCEDRDQQNVVWQNAHKADSPFWLPAGYTLSVKAVPGSGYELNASTVNGEPVTLNTTTETALPETRHQGDEVRVEYTEV